jgi:hypothetical protein
MSDHHQETRLPQPHSNTINQIHIFILFNKKYIITTNTNKNKIIIIIIEHYGRVRSPT